MKRQSAYHNHFRLKPLFAILALSFSMHVSAGEVNINGGLSTEYVKQSLDDVNSAINIESDNFIVKPFLSFGYDARDLDIFINVDHNHVRSSLQDTDVTNNYTSFKYDARYDIVRNLLAFQIRGSQGYQSLQENSFLVDDFLLNAENLRKNTNNSASLLFSFPEGDYIGIDAQVGARRTKSDGNVTQQSQFLNSAFVNTNYNGAINIVGGRDLRPFLYTIDLGLNNTERQDQQNFDSQSVSLMIGSYLSSDISLRLLGSYEDNELTNDGLDTLEEDILREFYSYGVGIGWQPSANRFIELGYNRSTTSGLLNQEDQENDFVSLDVNWNFSARTSVSGKYSRRFFGNSGRFSFKHNLRNWRSSLTYTEEVNTNSQLGLAEEDGAFLCPNGSTQISDCSIPEQINPDNLAPGEFLVPFVTRSLELNDRVIIRKQLTAQTSFERRRTTFSASVINRTDEEVEIERDVEVLSGRLGVAIKASPRSTIKLDMVYSDLESTFNGERFPSKTKEVSLDFERRMSRRLFASIGFRYLDREGEINRLGDGGNQNIFGITGPLTDRRITAEIRYEFDSKR
jgi:uncharacterized protein (PEP-CTERM system associated)